MRIATSALQIGVLRFTDYRLSFPNFLDEHDSSLAVYLLHQGCVVSSAVRNMSTHQALKLSNLSLSAIDGFKIVWPASYNASSVLALLEGSADRGNSWSVVGSSSFVWIESGVLNLGYGGAPVTSGQMTIDFRPPWPFYVHYVVTPCFFVAGWIFMLVCARHSIAAARRAALASLTIFLLISASSATGFVLAGRSREAVGPLVAGACAAITAAVLCKAEPMLAEAVVLVGAIGTAEAIAAPCLLLSFEEALSQSPPITGPAMLLGGAALLLLRRSLCQALLSGVRADGEFYDREWDAFASAPVAVEALAAAEAGVAALRQACPAASARHFLPAARDSDDCDHDGGGGKEGGEGGEIEKTDWSSGGGGGHRPGSFRSRPNSKSLSLSRSFQRLASSGGSGGGDDRVPACSLDLLYAQAVAVAPLLRALCVGLAAACGGDLHDACALAGGPGGEGLCGPGLGRWVRRGWVKAPGRAVRKAAAAGGRAGDASRVLDVCRGRIRVGSPGSTCAPLCLWFDWDSSRMWCVLFALNIARHGCIRAASRPPPAVCTCCALDAR